MRILTLLALLSTVALAGDTPPASPSPAPKLSSTAGFNTPESVLYDAKSDTWLVSNIGGSPLDRDNNGYISELSPDGKVKTERWIEGGKNGVTLNAPKGSALKDGVLYVADIDVVRMFDRKTGASKGEIAIPGATFLNDVALGGDGNVYVSDSGLTAEFKSSGTEAIYRIKPGAQPGVETLVKSPELKGPNGLLVTKDSVHVVFFGANELQTFDMKGQKQSTTQLPNGGLDGIVAVGQDVLVSSWGGKALYRGKPGGTFTAVVSELEAPADVGYDSKRGLVLVPRFMGNAVEAWEIK